MDPSRLVRVDSAVFADALVLIGHAWIKRGAGDIPGAAVDLYEAMRLLPEGGTELITGMIERGELPEPSPDPDAMEAWLERCRQAAAGDLKLTIVRAAPEQPPVESEADFLKRLHRMVVEGEAKRAPVSPAEAEELRTLGLM